MAEEPGGKPGLGRREFLANAVLAVAGLLSVGTLAERFLAFLYPIVPPEREIELDVLARDQLPTNGGKIAHTPLGHIALIDRAGEVSAYSAVCTHLGCIIQYAPMGQRAWLCPCHKGAYDAAGKVIAGPPPRGLTPLPVAVRDGRVFVKLKRRPPEAGT